MWNSEFGSHVLLFIDPARGLFAPTVRVYVSKYYWSFLKDLCFIVENAPFSFFEKAPRSGVVTINMINQFFVMTFVNKKQTPSSGRQTPNSGGAKSQQKE